ncbi:hypothetical protein [Imtechella halotolerans]|uniref:Uncharacterized protein n=1 Tax=Imtechella halotolerans K1 TaxID=946077 RepID=I0W5H6_9FLAO|nr:hypothetical protein [Imtechella halotolerans]EID71642.1 hypothetical protein W5A_13510 [Imtechella halotolerans K1]WMQ63970.1 hypothetical protein PT603_03125 [Imtechella halotolerans]
MKAEYIDTALKVLMNYRKAVIHSFNGKNSDIHKGLFVVLKRLYIMALPKGAGKTKTWYAILLVIFDCLDSIKIYELSSIRKSLIML